MSHEVDTMTKGTPTAAGFEPLAEVSVASPERAGAAVPDAVPASDVGPAVTAERRLQAELRRQHAGQWVGWTPDFRHVVVFADTPEGAWEAGARSGDADLVYEFVALVPSRGDAR
jgi:hypothetical protein